MLKRRLLCLLAAILGLTLLPVTALARDHDRDWGRNRWTHNQNYRNGYYGNGYKNGNYGNGNYRCVDPDGDGDCDHVRHHHHHRHYQNGYYQNGWYPNGSYSNPYAYSNPNVWGNNPYTGVWGNGNRRWGNARLGNGSVPQGWQNGRKKGWGNSNLPPGLAKKSGWW